MELGGPSAGLHVVAKNNIPALAGNRIPFVQAVSIIEPCQINFFVLFHIKKLFPLASNNVKGQVR
jgi:hypothetical protein